MTLTPQLMRKAIKKKTKHPSSLRKPYIDFRKLAEKPEQAEITKKLKKQKSKTTTYHK